MTTAESDRFIAGIIIGIVLGIGLTYAKDMLTALVLMAFAAV